VIERSGGRSVVRAIRRLVAHARRAFHAIRRAGPGRYPGSIIEIELTAGGDIAVAGFAHLPGESVASVIVTVDGRIVGGASVDVDSPDLAAARPADAGSSRAGWRLVVPRRDVPAGPVTFDAVALTRSGLTETLGSTTWTMPIPHAHAAAERVPTLVTGELETTHTFSYESGALIVTTGWVAPARQIERVEVFVDDVAAGPARQFCVPRSDIADRLADPTAAFAGFWHLAEVDRAPGTTVRVSVHAVSRVGHTTLGQRDVVIAPLTKWTMDGWRHSALGLTSPPRPACLPMV
jgi:hypothetical protein